MKDINWNEAPEWADRALKTLSGKNIFSSGRYFLGVDGNKIEHGSVVDVLSGGHEVIAFRYEECRLIEMRPEQEATEWKPSVGEECEVNIGSTDLFEVATIKYISNQIVISSVGGHEFSSQASITKFRPLRTEAEKKREAFIERGLKVISTDNLGGLLGDLFDAGCEFTAPKGEG